MYDAAQLSRYPYFEERLMQFSLEMLLDPLTGLVSRAYILGFVRALIDAGTPFTFGILDLDNFKFINDTYGHSVGDQVLSDVAGNLARFLDGYGLAGRFGGDEFLFVNLRDRTYADKKAFLSDLYSAHGVLRRSVTLPDCDLFITGTVGCATCPDDARDYETLFSLIDKTLYRGKVKGRNCYIIYVEEKHRDIRIRHIARDGIYTLMHRLARQFEMVPGLRHRLSSVTPVLMDALQVSDLYYTGPGRVLRSVRNRSLKKDVGDIDELLKHDDHFTTNTLERLRTRCPRLHAALTSMEVESLMIVRVSMDGSGTNGYLLCAEPRSLRIWQEDECALLYFLAKLIAARIRLEGETLDD